MRYLFAILMAAMMGLAACASIHGAGNYAMPISGKVTSDVFKSDINSKSKSTTPKGLLISGSENTSLSSDYFTLIDLTFENTSADWLRVTKVALDFGGKEANEEIRFPVGQDLLDWAQGAQQVKAIRNYNMQMALTAVAGAGTVVAATSGSKSAQTTGAVVAAGSGMVLSANSIGSKLDSLQRAQVIPEDHLLSGNFTIPPGLPKRKWITLYTKRPNEIPFIGKLVLTFTYDNGSTETVILKFRDLLHIGSSDWQKKHPAIKAAKRAEEKKSIGM